MYPKNENVKRISNTSHLHSLLVSQRSTVTTRLNAKDKQNSSDVIKTGVFISVGLPLRAAPFMPVGYLSTNFTVQFVYIIIFIFISYVL